METFSALLTICAGNSPMTGEFPAQRPVTQSCDVFFDLRLNKRLSKQSWGWWFKTPSRPLWRHCNKNSHSFIAYSRSSLWLFQDITHRRFNARLQHPQCVSNEDTAVSHWRGRSLAKPSIWYDNDKITMQIAIWTQTAWLMWYLSWK